MDPYCGLIGVDLIRFPLLFQVDNLLVGSPGRASRSRSKDPLLESDHDPLQGRGCLREYFREPCGISRFFYVGAEGLPPMSEQKVCHARSFRSSNGLFTFCSSNGLFVEASSYLSSAN